MDPLSTFHPLVRGWFTETFGEPTAPQRDGWQEIASGRHTLIAAPTGSGKTLAAFLWAINRLVERALDGTLAEKTYVVYISPLKALANDIERNLQAPLRGICERAAAEGIDLPEIRVAVRSGDTPSSDRTRMLRKPPHILITTPESLFILLTAEGSRNLLATAETMIVDEIHAVAGDKRGSHLALSLERLDALAGRPLQRVGLSATQKPIEQIADLLVGTRPEVMPSDPRRTPPRGADSSPAARNDRLDVAIVDVGHKRPMHLSINIPDQELGPIATHEMWDEIYERIVAQVESHRTTLVFVNTRRLVERVAHQLSERLGIDRVAAHHGSLSRETRLLAEQRLKSGDVPVVVATASLELGIDIGHVDLVCHIGAPRLLSTLLQRVGRSGHWLGAIPKGILYPLTRDELVQCAAAIRAVRAGELDRIHVPTRPLDILAQQMVAIAATGEITEQDLFDLVRRSYPYRDLLREDFDEVLEMLSEGIATGRGRRSAYLHRDRVHGMVRPRRGARLAAITSGGAIPDLADYDVIEDPAGTFVGKVHEDFAVESLAGDIFLLGNQSWRIRRVEAGRVRVEDAHGAPPTIPFWLGEAPARSQELSAAVSDLREQVALRLRDSHQAAIAWLQEETGLEEAGAAEIVDYVAETLHVLGTVPTQDRVVAERFFDEAGGMQLVLHTPFGGRINRAWGLTLRKRFCVTFDFELQAAATDDGIVISLGEQHSFPLESVFRMVRPATLESDLTQAAMQSPMFTNRWRWNATRSLALLRQEGGRRVPMNLQRMRAEDLLAAVFPDSVACQDNHNGGPIVPPDHPLVNETIDNCLREAMDLDGLRDILLRIDDGEIETLAVETPTPSPMSHEILNANPYAYLDDAPLEERRARAVSLRRTDPDLAGGIGALDPEAIAVVRSQAWPDLRDAEELHDFLLTVGILPMAELGEWRGFADELIATHRATLASWAPDPTREERHTALIAAERIGLAAAIHGPLDLDPPISEPPGMREIDADNGVRLIVQGWLEALGPTTVSELATRLGLTPGSVQSALAALEGKGVVLRGQFTTGNGLRGRSTEGIAADVEWCERRLLARIHRMTLGRLRQEIEPVSVADFIRFLLRWQHVEPAAQLHGKDGLGAVIGQLQGLELPAPAWEAWVLPGRIARYDAADLEQLCLSGLVAWGRLSRGQHDEEESSEIPVPGSESSNLGHRPTRNSALATRSSTRNSELSARSSTRNSQPVARNSRKRRQAAGRQAPLAFLLREDLHAFLEPGPYGDGPKPEGEALVPGLSSEAREVADFLVRRGASFLSEIARATGRVPTAVENGLWELVARGLVTGDGIAGLRVLLQPESKRQATRRHLRSLPGGRGSQRTMPVGRWALWGAADGEPASAAERAERFAWQLLRRYGVVFRDLLARESQAPPWRVLLPIYRRLEARGEIRGGRFVAGLVGEQYALPEAVDALRAVRRTQLTGAVVLVHTGDPLNLVGILTPGSRISPFSNQVIAYRDGIPVEVGQLGAVRSRLQLGELGKRAAR